MFSKTFLHHIVIEIEADDETVFRMLNQYPSSTLSLGNELVQISVNREKKINYDVTGYCEILPGFNVGSNIVLKRFCNDTKDIIFRKSSNSMLRIDRDFQNKTIFCKYSGCVNDCSNFIAAVVETFVINVVYMLGYFPVHGAVLKNGSMCIALCGGSGVGKSTTALQLLSQGGCLLSNDLFYLDTKTMWGYSLDKTLGMRELGFGPVSKYVEEIKMKAPYIYSTDQRYYDMQLYLKNKYTVAEKLDAIFFLKKTAGISTSVGNICSFKDFMDCCIFPSKIIDKKINFLECYKEIKANCLTFQMELPDFRWMPDDKMRNYIVDWDMLIEFYVESRCKDVARAK